MTLFCGGVLTTGMMIWSITSRLEMPLTSTAPGYHAPDVGWQAQPQSAVTASCECLLQLHCPRYNFSYQQVNEAICRIYTFRYGPAKSCMQWRRSHFGRSTHVVLLGDLRLLYLYRYLRDELLSDSERIEGPAYCKSVHKNWTHSYLAEDRNPTQPPPPCRHLATNKLAKLEYYWTDDSRWHSILQKMLDRCRLGLCPAVVVVSSRLDLVLREHEARRELSLAGAAKSVKHILPLLEQLKAYGVHVWWKTHENLLDVGTGSEDVPAINEIMQEHNLKVISALSRSTVPAWTSTAAVGWGHHQRCMDGGLGTTNTNTSTSTTADFRCSQPYYLGNWAQQHYMDIIFNFLCGRALSMAQNPCCAGGT